jgi:hypothetical protein
VLPTLALALLQATTTGPPPGVDLGSLLTIYGPLGVFVVGLSWFARLAYRREADRSDRLEAEIHRITQERSQDFVRKELYDQCQARLDRLETSVREQMLPALQAAGAATRESLQVLESVRREQDIQARIRAHDRPGGEA